MTTQTSDDDKSFLGCEHVTTASKEQAHRSLPPPLRVTDILWLLVAMLLSLALRIPFFNIPMIHDEGGYAYATRGWLDGSGHLYDDLWISRPQGIFMLYGLVFRFLGESVWALRFTAWLFAAATILAIWLLARRWTASRTANLAAIIGAVTLALPNIEGFTANAEIFMGLPLAFAAFMLVRQAQTQWSPTHLFSVGVLIGIATLLKPSGIVMVFTAVTFIFMVAPGPRAFRLRLSLITLGGVTLVGVLTLIHGWYLGWSDFLYATVTYRLTLQSSATVSTLHHLQSFGKMIWNTVALLCLTLMLLAFRTLFLVRMNRSPAAKGQRRWRPQEHLISHLRQNRRLSPREMAGLMIQLWAIGAVAGIAMGGDWW